MDLYRKIKRKTRGARDRDVRIKLELFLLAIKLGNVTEACARRGFSRQFYYRWWVRFERSGFSLASLSEKSRRPKRSPGRVGKEIEAKIHWYRRRKYGARQIQAMLARQGHSLSRTTICHILKKRRKRSLLTKKARLRLHRKRYELLIPGQRMQMDVKYVPYPVDGRKTYTYVIIDECTRWRFARAYHSLDEGTTVRFLNEFKLICPFPVDTIQTDNGQEFTYALNPVAQHLEHKVDTWCGEQGIKHRRIPPGVKELNGKVERSHRLDEQYFYWKAPSHDLQKFNRALNFWMGYYNAQRLHGGIGFLTPLEKLQERSQTLQTQTFADHPDGKLEPLRIKFLESLTKRKEQGALSQQDRRIQILESSLQRLLKKVA